MIQKYRQVLVAALKTFDMSILIFSLLLLIPLSDSPAANIQMGQFTGLRVSVRTVALITGFFIIWHVILSSYNLYVSRRLSTFREEIIGVLKAISFGTMFLLLFTMIFNIRMVNAVFLLLFWVNTSFLTILGRLVLRYGVKQLRIKGLNQRNIVIAGVRDRAILFAGELLSKPELGYRLLGFVDDFGEKCPEINKRGYQLVADFDNFNEYLRRQEVDEVAICLPLKSHYQQAAHIASICEEHGIMVRFLSDVLNPKIAHSMTQQFEGHSIITFYTGNMQGGELIFKRMLDLALSLVLIAVLSPLFLLTALMVKLTSEGPAFFVQKRLGLNKHHFGVYKFRTMSSDAEMRQAELEHLNEVQGAAFKIKNDPRITPLGRILRRTSIDELPQLFNVLKGEMSLVGPRPLPIRDYEGFDKDWHRRRFSVRPGITCLWQVGGRSNISFDRWMELDMEYIDNWSLWLDFKILLMTISAVVREKGAV